MSKLIWNVFYHDPNTDEITTTNILDHGVMKDFYERQKEIKPDYKIFIHTLDTEIQYWYWAKSQYEVIVKDWIDGQTERKIDIYEQVKMNWDLFANYCYQYVCG